MKFENESTDLVEFKTKTRLYLPNEILCMLKEIGFHTCQAYHRPETSQDLYFHNPSANSKRIIVTGQL